MPEFTIRDANYAERVRSSFARQGFMTTLGARLIDVGPGRTEIHVAFGKELAQQHGFFHGGVIGTVADNTGAYASYTLMAVTDSILTIEYKLNIMAPANGSLLIARGQVLRPGRRVNVCQSDIFVLRDGVEHLCATMLGTFMTMTDTPDQHA